MNWFSSHDAWCGSFPCEPSPNGHRAPWNGCATNWQLVISCSVTMNFSLLSPKWLLGQNVFFVYFLIVEGRNDQYPMAAHQGALIDFKSTEDTCSLCPAFDGLPPSASNSKFKTQNSKLSIYLSMTFVFSFTTVLL